MKPPPAQSEAWRSVGNGWRPLHGDFGASGFSVEWHDFVAEEDFDWSPSFRPRAVEICMNLKGSAEVSTGARQLALRSQTAGFYHQRERGLSGVRRGSERHRFVTIELSFDFLGARLAPQENALHPALQNVFGGASAAAGLSESVPLTAEQERLVLSLRCPPVSAAARDLWYQAKVLEVASTLLYRADEGRELFCQRYKRQNRERAQRVIALLSENLAAPPALEEIARRVGCSQFHLSRIFSQEMGCGIFQYLRRLRLDRAAALLRQGAMNVTEVAMTVGYSSPSHFSTAFHEAFGCCPGLYPLRTLGPKPDAGLETTPARPPVWQAADKK